MRLQGFAPTSVTLVAALKACTSLESKGDAEPSIWGRLIHNLAVESECDSDIDVQSILINMYAECGSIAYAREVFDSMKYPDVVAWNTLIMGYADNGQGLLALQLFKRMKIVGGSVASSVTFVAALKACTSLALRSSDYEECRDRGRAIHNLTIEKECDSDTYVQSTLVSMYGKCSCMGDAHRVFESMKHPDVVAWNALISGYANNGKGLTALQLFTTMRSGRGPTPNSVTFLAALRACSLLGAVDFGNTIRSEIGSQMLDLSMVNCMVDFYAKCGSLWEARSVFESHAETRDLVTWNTLLAGFSSCGDHESVFRLFGGMQEAGLQPDSVTFLAILTCCSHAGLVEAGKECFDRMPMAPSVKHYNCMVDMLGRANRLDDAMALLHCTSCSPNDVTWRTLLGACRKCRSAELGRLAFQSLINVSDKDVVLMGQIYESRGMLLEQETVMAMRQVLQAWRMPAEASWTDELGNVHTLAVD